MLRTMAALTQYELSRQSGVERTRLSLAECRHIELRPEEYAAVDRALRNVIKRRVLDFNGVLSERSASPPEAGQWKENAGLVPA